MAWGGFILTNAGRNLLAKVQAGLIAQLNITRFGIGDGAYAGSFSTLTNLVSQKQSVPLRTKNAKDQFTNVDGYFSNEGLLAGFYFREWGIFAMDGAQEILYAYDNAGADAEYIAPDGDVRYEKMLKAALSISSEVDVVISTEGVILASKEEVDNLAGIGRTTETVKGNADSIISLGNNKTNKLRALSSKNAAYTIVAGDLDKNITVTGDTTITLTAIATLGLGFRCRISNIGAGVVSIVPSGTDTIATGTGITIYPGKCVEVVADYAGMWTVVGFDFTAQINSLEAQIPAPVTVVNDLTTGGTTSALSAEQGKNLNANKAPNSHASTGTTYGLGSTNNYGHVKTINGLTQSSHVDGTALSAYQGKVLNDLINSKVITGSYTGDGTTREINLGFKPSIVILDSGDITYPERRYTTIITNDYQAISVDNNGTVSRSTGTKLSSNGFTVINGKPGGNLANIVFNYIAFK